MNTNLLFLSLRSKPLRNLLLAEFLPRLEQQLAMQAGLAAYLCTPFALPAANTIQEYNLRLQQVRKELRDIRAKQ